MLYSAVQANKQTIHSDYLNDNVTDLLTYTFEIPSDYMASVTEVDEDFVARPDLLSKKLYGGEEYADILCKLNGISNPFELNAGMLLLTPAQDDLEKFIVRSDTAWQTTVSQEIKETEKNQNAGAIRITSTGLPIPATKTSSRKPNQAIIGDSRFNIDKVSKIVIY